MLAAAAPLPVFAPSFGHTYVPLVQKAPRAAQIGLSQHSKETTPMPGSQNDASQKTAKPAPESHSPDFQDTRTLIDAINMSLRYGKEYMNEMPLVGEPGNFRLSKTKDPASAALAPPNANQTAQPISSRQTSPSKATPAVSPPPPPPPIITDVPPVSGKKSAKSGDRTPATPGSGQQKPKRRKSKAAIKFDDGATS